MFSEDLPPWDTERKYLAPNLEVSALETVNISTDISRITLGILTVSLTKPSAISDTF